MTEQGKAGRPSHAPSERLRTQVRLMAAFGNTEMQIAAVIGITAPTLRKHYRVELETGHMTCNYNVAQNLYRQAIKDDPRAFPAIKFYLNCRAGWSEYAPPSPELAEKLGKKETAQLEAQTAEQGTGWSGLVN